MKSTEARIRKLESATGREDYPYVIHVSDPPTEAELAAMERNRTAGRPFVVVGHRCETVEEWLARYAPKEAG
jgi:hypothetical protein